LKDFTIKAEKNLPILGHEACGEESYNLVRKAKKGYYWRCPICQEVRFFQNPNVYNCAHEIEWKKCKNKFLTRYCPRCQIRIFKKEDEDRA
jgi:hypothetical protein